MSVYSNGNPSLEVVKNLPTKTQAKRHLPKVLMVDEFRSHLSAEDKMSFICADGETGQLIEVLPTRKLSRLTSYFQLIKRVSPHAKLVIDRFHDVKHMNQDFRVREMKRLISSGDDNMPRKVKSHWRLLTKNRKNINYTEYKT